MNILSTIHQSIIRIHPIALSGRMSKLFASAPFFLRYQVFLLLTFIIVNLKLYSHSYLSAALPRDTI